MQLLKGELSAAFNVEQGVAKGCSLPPIINGFLKQVEQADLHIELSILVLEFEDLVCVSDSGEQLQRLIDAGC